MALRDWSTTAASNNAAVPGGAPEGWAPSEVNNVLREVMAQVRGFAQDAQWFDYGDATITSRSSGTSFSLTGTHTATYAVGRRVQIRNQGGSTMYGAITDQTLTGGNTQITIAVDSGSLTGTVSAVLLSTITPGANSGHPGGWALIEHQSLSNAAATVAFASGIDDRYDHYVFVLADIIPSIDGAVLWMRTSSDGGSSYDAGASDYDWHAAHLGAAYAATVDATDSEITLSYNSIGGDADEGGDYIVYLFSPANAARYTSVQWRSAVKSTISTHLTELGAGLRVSAGVVNAVQFLMNSGNIASGRFAMYGLRR